MECGVAGAQRHETHDAKRERTHARLLQLRFTTTKKQWLLNCISALSQSSSSVSTFVTCHVAWTACGSAYVDGGGYQHTAAQRGPPCHHAVKRSEWARARKRETTPLTDFLLCIDVSHARAVATRSSISSDTKLARGTIKEPSKEQKGPMKKRSTTAYAKACLYIMNVSQHAHSL